MRRELLALSLAGLLILAHCQGESSGAGPQSSGGGSRSGILIYGEVSTNWCKKTEKDWDWFISYKYQGTLFNFHLLFKGILMQGSLMQIIILLFMWFSLNSVLETFNFSPSKWGSISACLVRKLFYKNVYGNEGNSVKHRNRKGSTFNLFLKVYDRAFLFSYLRYHHVADSFHMS